MMIMAFTIPLSRKNSFPLRVASIFEMFQIEVW